MAYLTAMDGGHAGIAGANDGLSSYGSSRFAGMVASENQTDALPASPMARRHCWLFAILERPVRECQTMQQSHSVNSMLTRAGSIAEFLALLAQTFEDKPAIAGPEGEALSYRQLEAFTRNTEEALRLRGVQPGQRVAVVLPQGMEMLLGFLSISRFSSFVPLNPEFTEREFAYFLEETGASALLWHVRMPTQALGCARSLGIPCHALLGWDSKGLCFEDDPVEPTVSIVQSPQYAQADDEAVLLATSGTTARPKLVPLTHANLLAGAANLVSSLSLSPEDCCLNVLPPFHIGALVDLLLAPLAAGSQVLVGREFSAAGVLAALTASPITWLQAVPTMLQSLLQHAQAEQFPAQFSALRFIRSVSAPLPETVKAAAENYFSVPLIEIYGMTETAGVICSNPLDRQRSLSVGLPVNQQIMIRDAQGNSARAGVKGEVLVQGSNVFSGYAGLDATEQENYFFGPWFRTGDEGYLDEEGFLFLSGRIKEIINRGGEKISPQEIDREITGFPGIQDAAAFAVKHETLGEDVALAVVSPRGIDENALREYLSERLARFKVPRLIYYLDSLPRNRSGKILRHQLSQQFDKQAEQNLSPLPETEPALSIARIWQKILRLERVGLQDNFFDLGGDSLSALSFLQELKHSFACEIHVTSLFTYPTLESFAEHLQSKLGTDGPEHALPQIAGLPETINHTLQAYLSAWQGERLFPGSLVVGLNTLGQKPPLFWCVQGYEELRLLSEALGPDQPVYGMRSLSQISGKNQSHTLPVANHYARELLRILPHGDFYLGGFCEGASFMFATARELQAQGREVALLCLHDRFIPQPYDGRVALFFCRDSEDNPFSAYLLPQRGWHQFYKGAVSMRESEMAHSYLDPAFPQFVSQLQEELAAAREQSNSAHRLALPDLATATLPEQAYRADIDILDRAPRLLSAGQKMTLRLRITNRSQCNWAPSSESGVIVASRWFNRRGIPRSRIDGSVEIAESLAPGQSINLSIDVSAPAKKGIRHLVVDLVDEGVCWFHEKGSVCLRLPVIIMPGGGLLNRLLNLIP